VRLHKVGQGTYSSVYKAVDNATGNTVALKKVRLDVADDDAVAFAAREVRLYPGLNSCMHACGVKAPGARVKRARPGWGARTRELPYPLRGWQRPAGAGHAPTADAPALARLSASPLLAGGSPPSREPSQRAWSPCWKP
jgi:serine/threonine protein kinase